MYIITSLTDNKLSLKVKINGTEEVKSLDNKFDQLVIDELTSDIEFMNSREILKYAECDSTSEKFVKVESEKVIEDNSSEGKKRGRKSNYNNENTEITDSSNTNQEEQEGGK